MESVRIEVKGLQETIRAMKKAGADAQDFKTAMNRIGTNVANAAKANVNSRTGTLANSIRASKTQNKSVVRAGRGSIPYAGVIHYGGYNNITANPYLTKAAVEERPTTIRMLNDELRTILQRNNLT